MRNLPGVILGVLLISAMIIGGFYFYYNRYVFAESTTEISTGPVYIRSANSEGIQYKVTAHIETPKEVRAVYISSWVAGSPSILSKILALIERTDINAVVVDVKDATGRVSYIPEDQSLIDIGVGTNRVRNIRDLLQDLHQRGLYVIGRVTVFQDPFYAQVNPDAAIRKKSDGSPWKDKKGLMWLDPTNNDVWEYVTAISEDAYNLGFDEINFDYIRYPSDGDIADLDYKLAVDDARAVNIRTFYEYIGGHFAEKGIPTSADLFGMTTTNNDDLGIGQILEDALVNFDYVAPMVYPSHYPSGFHNISDPAAEPYKIIDIAMRGAVEKAVAIGQPVSKLRPWIQDFNLGATYTAQMVKDQMDASAKHGIYSWMSWDPANTYTESAYLLDDKEL